MSKNLRVQSLSANNWHGKRESTHNLLCSNFIEKVFDLDVYKSLKSPLKKNLQTSSA
jgi:hypothetical protein